MSTNPNPWRASASFVEALEIFENAEASADVGLGPIQPGKYKAKLIGGELEKSRLGNTCYALRWEIAEGEYAGRRVVSRSWLTPKAISRAKAELATLGIGGEHLRGVAALPAAAAELSVVLRADEAGDTYNEVRRVRPVEVKPPEQAAAPVAESAAGALSEALGNDAAADDAFLDSEF